MRRRPPIRRAALALRGERGDTYARRLLVEANLRHVVSMAKRYQSHGLPLADLIQEGAIGFLIAVDETVLLSGVMRG